MPTPGVAPTVPSRRRLLAVSVPLLSVTAGCLGASAPDRADAYVSNHLDRAIVVRLTIESESGDRRALRRTVELASSGEDGDTETFPNPVGRDGSYVVRVLVKNGPQASGTFVDEGNGFDSRGLGQAQIDIRPDGIEIVAVTS